MCRWTDIFDFVFGLMQELIGRLTWSFVCWASPGEGSFRKSALPKIPSWLPSWDFTPSSITFCVVSSIQLLLFRSRILWLSSNLISGSSSIPTEKVKGWCGKTDAKEIRACCHVSPVKTATVPVWGFHVTNQVSSSVAGVFWEAVTIYFIVGGCCWNATCCETKGKLWNTWKWFPKCKYSHFCAYPAE
jgi:hypothetical protein